MLKYLIPFPDGTSAEKLTPDYVEHKFAVIGYLKLRRTLPPLNPDDKNEEPRYQRFTRWVTLGTMDTLPRAERFMANPVYPEATLESRIVPIEGVHFVRSRPGDGTGDDDETDQRGPFRAPSAPPAMCHPREFAGAGVQGTVVTLSPEQLQELSARGPAWDLKHIPLEESNLIVCETKPDGTSHLVELQGVTLQSVSTTYEEEPPTAESCDFGDL